MWSLFRGWVLLVLLGAVANAQGGGPIADGGALSVRLDWEAPAECIDGGTLAEAVSGQLGRPAFTPGAEAELVARGRIGLADNGRHRAEVALSTTGGEALGVRTLESDNRDCHSLDEALATMLAIMLNVSRADVPALTREAPVPEPPAPRWRPRAGGGAGVVVGLLPQAGVETLAGVGLSRGGRLEPGLELAWAWTGEADAAEGRLQVQAASARLAIAPVLAAFGTRSDLRLRLSAGAGPMWANASGFPQVFTRTRLVADGRAGLQLGLRVAGPVWLQAGAEVGWVPVRPTFAVDNADGTTETLFQPHPVIGWAGLTLAVRAR
jgi:hypothetical protein